MCLDWSSGRIGDLPRNDSRYRASEAKTRKKCHVVIAGLVNTTFWLKKIKWGPRTEGADVDDPLAVDGALQ